MLASNFDVASAAMYFDVAAAAEMFIDCKWFCNEILSRREPTRGDPKFGNRF